MTNLHKRLRCGCVVTIILMTAIAPRASAGSRHCHAERVSTRQATWSRMQLPEMETAPLHSATYSGLHDRPRFAVSGVDPENIYVADDWSVYESGDGGCSWSTALSRLTSDPTAEETDRIVALATPQRVGGAAHAYVLIDRLGVPTMGRQRNARGRWRLDALYDDAGVPLVGSPRQMWIAPSDPRVLYVLLWTDSYSWDGSTSGMLRLYRSDDGGDTWDLRHSALSEWRSSVGDVSCAMGPNCALVDTQAMAIDPFDPNVLWTADYDGVFRSDDGGATWRRLFSATSETLGEIRRVGVFGRARSKAVVAFGSSKLAWSVDDGRSWSLRDSPVGYNVLGSAATWPPVESVGGAGPNEIVASLDQGRSYGGANLQLFRGRRWSTLRNPFSQCHEDPSESDGSGSCLMRLQFLAASNSYYAIEFGAEHLLSFRLQDRR